MATHCATEKKEKVNHAKLCLLLYDGGGTALRSVVDRCCPPATLAATLKAKKPQLQKLKGNVLKNDQWNKLYSPSGTSPSTKDFDITLLFVLIRNICGLTKPATGWNALPPTTDKSTEANLVRIKYYRNTVIGHSENAEVDDIQYEAYWKDISSALVSLGLDQDDIDDLKARPFGDADYFKLLKEWQLAETDIKDQLCDIKSSIASGFTNMGEQISQIQKSTTPSETDKLFHQEFRSHISSKCSLYHPNTRAWILEKVKTHVESDFKDVLVIQAGPGMGKSVLAARIWQMYQDSQENQTILGACHFFQHNDPSRNNPRLMLQSVAWQLCRYLPEYKVAVEKVLQSNHMRNRDISVLSCTELFTLLFEEPFSHLGHVPTGKLVVVIDALDECCNSLKTEFFQVIGYRLHYLPSWLRFVMTTRPPPNISSQVPGSTTKIDPNDSQNTEDLQRFFADKLKELPHLCSDQQQHSHMEQLVDLTGGLFLVASFVIDFLKKPRINSLAEALEHFPKGKGITAVYEDYFSRLRDDITPYLKSEEGFYNMLDAVVKARSPIEKKMFYDILGFPLKESRIPDTKKKEAVNLLHQLFPVENDHVSPFHKTVVDWLTTGDHDFAAKGDGIGVLASACYNVLMNAKQEIFENPQNQLPQLTDKEIYACEFGFDYMEESQSFNKENEIAADPYVLLIGASYAAHSFKSHNDNGFRQRLSPDLQDIYDQMTKFLGSHSRPGWNECIVQELTIQQCLEFAFRAINVLKIETEESNFNYLKDNCHERKHLLTLETTIDTVVLPSNDGFLISAYNLFKRQTLVKKYHHDGTFVNEVKFSEHRELTMFPDYKLVVVCDSKHFTDKIDVLDVATFTFTTYKLPSYQKSLHVFGSQPWYIVVRCFDNKIYVVELGETGASVGDPCSILQTEDVICVSNVGHILITRTSNLLSCNNLDQVFTDEEGMICFEMAMERNSSSSMIRDNARARRCEYFLCNFKELDKRFPIYFRYLHCRERDDINTQSSVLRERGSPVLFSEDGDILAFHYADCITVVNTSDGSLYASVCLYHQGPVNWIANILFLSKTRIVIQGSESMFSYSLSGESRPRDAVEIEHIYYSPGARSCFVTRRSHTNIREILCTSHSRDFGSASVHKYLFLDK